MYLIVKRRKSVYFVELQPHDTVAKFMQRIPSMLNFEKEATELKLFHAAAGSKQPPVYTALEDSAVFDQLGINDQDVLYMSYWIGDGTSGKWEPIEITPYEPLHDDLVSPAVPVTTEQQITPAAS